MNATNHRVYLSEHDVTLHHGHVLDALPTLRAESVNCVVTSPPYYGLRDYAVPPSAWPEVEFSPMPGLEPTTVAAMTSCLGLEPTPTAFIAHIVEIFRQVHRVLRSDGVLWLNIGDSYAGKANGGSTYDRHRGHGHRSKQGIVPPRINNTSAAPLKSLIGIPWRIAFALQADGWIIRNAITWNKPNAMPETVKDRLSSRHEQLFLLTKEPSYWFDLDPIREPIENRTTAAADLEQLPGVADGKAAPLAGERGPVGHDGRVKPYLDKPATALGRNPGDVWTIPTAPYPAAHFATFPRELARRCILAGCPPQVCPSCGHLPQRQTHTAQRSTGRPANSPRTVQRRHQSHGTAGYTARTVAAHTTIGWTACDCGVPLTPGVVLDPFAGASTTLMVARQLMRNSIGIELSPDYCAQSAHRIGPAGFDFDAASRSSADMAQDTG